MRFSVYKKIWFAALFCLLALVCFTSMRFARAEEELKNNDPERFYIILDLKNQIVTVYQKDESGEYTDIVRRFLCSSGSNTPTDPENPDDIGTPTSTGIWKIGGRQRFGAFASFSDYARYWVQIVGDIFFHSVLFNKMDVNTLTGSYSRLGTAVSHGCVRLCVEDAKWLYYYACPGTTVEVSDQKKTDSKTAKALKSLHPDFKTYKAMQAGIYETPQPENETVWVSVANAPLRKGNDKSYATIRRLDVGTELEVIIKSPAYYMVRHENRVGYIHRGLITETQGEMDTVENAMLVKATAWMFDKQEAKTANRICKVPTETCVEVLEEDGKWIKIRYYAWEGWIQTKDLFTDWGFDYAKANVQNDLGDE